MREGPKFSARSDRGLLRKNNEDSFVVLVSDAPWPASFVVADGMGGHKNGALASQVAVRYCQERLSQDLPAQNQPEQMEALLLDIVQKANVKVYMKSLESEANQGMGTTLTLAVFYPQSLYIAHVGDSRCYVQRRGILERLTVDHTVVQEMLDAGGLREEEVQNHPMHHMVTQALGVPEYLKPMILHVESKRGDRYLLSSDGLHGYVDAFQLGEALRQGSQPEACTDHLIDLALQAGGPDNITVITVFT